VPPLAQVGVAARFPHVRQDAHEGGGDDYYGAAAEALGADAGVRDGPVGVEPVDGAAVVGGHSFDAGFIKAGADGGGLGDGLVEEGLRRGGPRLAKRFFNLRLWGCREAMCSLQFWGN